MRQKLYLIIREFFSGPFINGIVFLSVTVSVFSAVLFTFMEEGFNDYIKNRFASSIPPNTLKVSPRPGKTVMYFLVRDSSVRPLSRWALTKIKNMPGVKSADPVLNLSAPLQGKISLFGLNYRTDLLCIGVPYSVIKKDIRPVYRRRWLGKNITGKVPVLVPRTVLTTYNEGLAAPNNLPRISPRSAIGLTFDLVFGHSSIRSLKGFEARKGVIAGYTDTVGTLSLVVPYSLVQYYNNKFNKGKREEYLHAFVKVENHASLLRVSRSVKKMGFMVEAEKGISKQILSLRENVNMVLSSLKYLIVFLSVVAVSFSTLIATVNRIEYYKILRILGASKYYIAFMIFVKYAFYGWIGTQCGFLLIKYFSGRIMETVNIPGVAVQFDMGTALSEAVLILGIVIPLLSALPSVFHLFLKGLSRY